MSVLEQFGLAPEGYTRGRGGIIASTRNGLKLLYECSKSDSFYEREDRITQCLAKTGFLYIDEYCRTLEGGLFAEDARGTRYILKNWYDSRECDIRNVTNVMEAVSILANLHKKMQQMERADDLLRYNNSSDLRMKFDKHTKEMRMIGNYLKKKKNKNEFEMLARKSLNVFHEQALAAMEALAGIDYGERIETARNRLEFCHGSYNYHNILFLNKGNLVANFDHCFIDCQITDLYQFMRKILEKNAWNEKIGYNMIDAYNNIKPVSDIDMSILRILFIYPEKFWKIINYYYGSNKTLISRKSIEKLQDVIALEEKRQNFLQSLH